MMPLTVWKEVLNWPTGRQTVTFPAGAELLMVGPQGADLCVWARVDPSAERGPAEYLICTCGTGHLLEPDAGKYLGSWQEAGGLLVFHAFGRQVS